MKLRVITGVVGAIILVGMNFTRGFLFSTLVAIAALIGLLEFYSVVAKKDIKPVRVVGYLAALSIAFVPFLDSALGTENAAKTLNFFLLGLFVIVFLLLMINMFSTKYNLVDIAVTFFGIFFIPFSFSFVISTKDLRYGDYLVWIIFLGAFATDIAAYFVGTRLGKRNIVPTISPKKTTEGAIGGLVGSILSITIFALFLTNTEIDIAVYHYIILGVLCGIIAQLGDWAASSIKRQAGVKDYGTIMPGHGGLLDRLDSLIFVAPVVYFYLTTIVNI